MQRGFWAGRDFLGRVFSIKHLQLLDICGIHILIYVKYIPNAMKETHLAGNDRNTASPTESAVCGEQGAGTLRSRLLEPCGADFISVMYV